MPPYVRTTQRKLRLKALGEITHRRRRRRRRSQHDGHTRRTRAESASMTAGSPPSRRTMIGAHLCACAAAAAAAAAAAIRREFRTDQSSGRARGAQAAREK